VKPNPPVQQFLEVDEVVPARGSNQGTLGVFLRLRHDVPWADIRERSGIVKSHPPEWLSHAKD
jgi:hypothetical protein